MMGFINKTGKFLWNSRHFLLIACSLCVITPLTGQPGLISENEFDSLENKLHHLEGTEKVDLLLNLSQTMWFQSFDKSLNYAARGYQLAKELNYREGMADALNRIGNIDYLLGNYDNVFDLYSQAAEIAISMDDYRRMGTYLNNIGLLYRELARHDSAEVYLLKSLEAKEAYGDKELLISTLNNLGVLYRDISKHDLSMIYFNRQLEILEENRSINRLPLIHRQIGEVLHLQECYPESLIHFFKSLEYAQDIADNESIAQSYYYIAKSCFATEDYDDALEYLDKSIELAKTLKSQTLLRNNYHLLYGYHKQTGRYQDALEYLTLYNELKDSLQKQYSTTRYNQLERVFDIKHHNSRIDLQQKENRIQQLQIGRHENLEIFLIITVLMLVLFMLIAVYRYRQIQRTHHLLKQKISELEKTNGKLRLSALSLEQLNATKNRFFSIIAHDLKNPFNALLGFSEIITTNFNNLQKHEIREYISIVHQSSRNLFKLLENLLKWSAAQTGTMRFLPEKFDLVSLINSEILFHRISALKKQITISNNLPEELIVNSDKLLLSSVIRNLTDNAIKFTRPGGTVGISARENGREVIVEIDDSGIGIPEEMQKKLFKIDSDISRKGTNKEEGSGLGLILCKELLEKAGGSIGLKNKPGTGSCFWFTLPRRPDN
jgi:signal transduction histidine kinase